jgi:hypothetical protein
MILISQRRCRVGWKFDWIRNTGGYCNKCGGGGPHIGVFKTGENPYEDVWLCCDCLAESIRKINPDYKLKPVKQPMITYDFRNRKWEGITVDQVKFWERSFPGIDVVDILIHKMPAWLDANPEKGKKTKWKRFIVGWLSRQQDRRAQEAAL